MHNDLLQIAVRMGLVGFIAFCRLPFSFFRLVTRNLVVTLLYIIIGSNLALDLRLREIAVAEGDMPAGGIREGAGRE